MIELYSGDQKHYHWVTQFSPINGLTLTRYLLSFLTAITSMFFLGTQKKHHIYNTYFWPFIHAAMRHELLHSEPLHNAESTK